MSTQLETGKTRLGEEWREKMDGLERQLETVNSQHVLELDALRDSIRVCVNIPKACKINKFADFKVSNITFNIFICVQDELAAENMKRMEELTDELEKSHQVELDELKQSITQQYEGSYTPVQLRHYNILEIILFIFRHNESVSKFNPNTL